MFSLKIKIIAAIAVLILASGIVYKIWDSGRNAEQTAVTKKVNKNIKVSNEVQDKNRRSSDADIAERLQLWQRD